jgi:hypothetical protein
MLHHAAMSEAELVQLETALARWTRHPNARWHRMNALAGRQAAAAPLIEEST